MGANIWRRRRWDEARMVVLANAVTLWILNPARALREKQAKVYGLSRQVASCGLCSNPSATETWKLLLNLLPRPPAECLSCIKCKLYGFDLKRLLVLVFDRCVWWLRCYGLSSYLSYWCQYAPPTNQFTKENVSIPAFICPSKWILRFESFFNYKGSI